MEKHDIKLRCLDIATRDSGVQGFVVSQVLNKAKGFYDWVIEGDAETQVKKTRGRSSVTYKKAGKR